MNVDLPWMPARLEQRIGRVDRIGQRRLVHAVHLVGLGTAEEEVLARLVLRIGRERAALGAADNPLGARAELDVARVVFGDVRELPPPHRLPEEDEKGVRHASLEASAEEERIRLERARLLAAADRRGADHEEHPPDAFGRPRWTVLRRRRGLAQLPPGLVCLFAARFVDDRGSLVEETLLALHVSLAAPVLAGDSLAGELIALLAACRPDLARRASLTAVGRLEGLRTRLASQLAPLAAREAAISARDLNAHLPLQAGLFDRRALKLADEARNRHERDATESASRLHELSRRAEVELAGEPELVLVLGIAV